MQTLRPIAPFSQKRDRNGRLRAENVQLCQRRELLHKDDVGESSAQAISVRVASPEELEARTLSEQPMRRSSNQRLVLTGVVGIAGPKSSDPKIQPYMLLSLARSSDEAFEDDRWRFASCRQKSWTLLKLDNHRLCEEVCWGTSQPPTLHTIRVKAFMNCAALPDFFSTSADAMWAVCPGHH